MSSSVESSLIMTKPMYYFDQEERESIFQYKCGFLPLVEFLSVGISKYLLSESKLRSSSGASSRYFPFANI